MDPILTILIPTYQNPDHIYRCVQSLLLATEFPYRIIVLNNDPHPDMRQHLDNLFSQVGFTHFQIEHLDGNKGWMGAINHGMTLVDTPLTCLLNDDVVFIPGQRDFWRRLVGYIDDHTAAVGPSSNFVMGQQSLFDVATPPAFPVNLLIGFCLVMMVRKPFINVFRRTCRKMAANGWWLCVCLPLHKVSSYHKY